VTEKANEWMIERYDLESTVERKTNKESKKNPKKWTNARLLVGGEGHAISMARAGPENDAESIQIAGGSTELHHFDGGGGEAGERILPPWKRRRERTNKTH